MSSTHLLLEHAAVQRQIRRGLVAYWPLASGGAVDLRNYWSGNTTLTLSNNGTVTRAAGPSNTLPDAANFAAVSSQFLSLASVPAVQLGNNQAFSITFWFYLADATGNYQLVSKDNSVAGTREWEAAINATPRVTFTAFDSGVGVVGSSSIPITLSATTWYHFSIVYNGVSGANALMRLNNANETSITMNGGTTIINSSTAEMEIGARQYAPSRQFLNGRIMGVTLHKRVLTSAERAWLYNSGAGRNLLRVL